ncbi:hypothetical protein E8E13_001233 [Curvularia kusanoi]|uniref:Hydrophobin n=1 Tax=Curvularia kusanoi TaxID=90978 RepID=A0A9P4W361_CURKU|nr:hypothetical protein E8E13_001233 [Curvularia kusanoi]
MKLFLSSLFLAAFTPVLAVPVTEASPDTISVNSTLVDRDLALVDLDRRQGGKQKGKGKEDCQKPIAQNLCTSGSPYCCSGIGDARVCGPASTVSCETLTICCINTNGMQICAGEIDFTGPVTININYGKMKV